MADTYTYEEADITYLGRWIDRDDGKQNAWSGATIRFKVSGTLNLKLFANIVSPDTNTIMQYAISIDGADWVVAALNSSAIYTGEKSHTFAIADTNEHEIAITMLGWWYLTYRFKADIYKMIFTKMELDTGAVLSAWPQVGTNLLATIGDSWMGTSLEWVSQLDENVYSVYPLGNGGFRSQNLRDAILYDYEGVLATSDPVVDMVVINSSVNDYNDGATLSEFNGRFTTLVQNTRSIWPNAPLFLLQSPDNGATLFSKYGPEMSDIADSMDNVYYIPIAGIDALTWIDANHLVYASRQILAAFVGDAITTHLASIPQVTIDGNTRYISSDRLAGNERIATIYEGTTPYTYIGETPVLTSNPSKMVGYVSGG